MATLHPISEINVFSPAATHAMAAAFDQAWQELQAMGHVCAAPFRATATRQKLAARILELARQGEDDVSVLKDHAVAYLLWSVSPSSLASATEPAALVSPRG